MPALIDDCKESKACASAAKHFAHCEEKVNAGNGYHGEDCVEELYVPIIHVIPSA